MINIVKFQFLIGSLETASICILFACPLVFQFLIGSLETFLLSLDAVDFRKFQFLIGSLETNFGKIF